MRYFIAITLCFCWNVTFAAHAAQPADTAAAHAAVVAPFVNANTVAVAHVDFSTLHVEPLMEAAADLVDLGHVLGNMPQGLEADERMRKFLADWLEILERNGIRDVYLVVGLDDLPNNPPMVIVPLPETAAGQQMAEFLLASFQASVHKTAHALVACDDRQWQRYNDSDPAARPELISAFEAAGDATAQVLILPTADARRAFEELTPTLPEQVGGVDSSVITRGARWVAVSLDARPELSVRLHVQSSDPAAAAELDELWANALKFAAADKALGKMVPNIDEAARLLTPKVEEDRLTLLLDQNNSGIAALIDALKPAVHVAGQSAARRRAINNLKQIALALHVHHDVYKSFPPTASYDADGKPLLSWRVHVLPYLDQQALYEQFHLDEPWDSEHNRTLIERMPAVYASPLSKLAGGGKTNYLLPAGEHAMFADREGPSFSDIVDGTSSTIMLLEVDDEQAVEWTKPEDLQIDPERARRGLGGLVEGGFHVGMGDGSVRFISNRVEPATLRVMFTPDGRELVPDLP